MIDTHQKGGVHAFGVVCNHRIKAQGAGAFGRYGCAEEAGCVVEKEHDIFGRDLLRSHNQITLVLSVLVIDDNHDFAPADCLNSVADLGEASVLVPAIHLECRIAPTV
tara:strand:- start:411 stop:734 length:324 start_codon:yes stop_codon:yes gene_type:complete